MNILPIYWKTKTIILDDDIYFLEELKELLSAEEEGFIFLNDPIKALDYVNTQHSEIDWYINPKDPLQFGKMNYEVNYDLICSMMHDKSRLDSISCIVTDYQMPQMNGIEFYKKIHRNEIFRKILLTASMPYFEVIQLLNQQVIDSFIDKKDISKRQLFLEHLNREKYNFFQSKSRFIIESIQISSPNSPYLSNEYTKVLANILAKYGIIEYYLLNQYGWYLLINNLGQQYYFFFFSEEDINEMAIEAKENIQDQKIFMSLQSYNNALCYYDMKSAGAWPEYNLWASYLKPVEKCRIGDVNYYYAISELPKAINI
jgi:CheY-like chemotaxis protein